MGLEERLEGGFAITAEASLPGDGDHQGLLQEGRYLSDHVDAVGVPDNPRGIPKPSPLALSRLLMDNGIEPIMHMACANRNRVILRSDLMGASALGIKNVLIVTGDHPLHGSEPGAKPVFDIDSVSALAMADPIEGLFPGCASNPWAEPRELHIRRLKDKIEAGARFIMTQPVFDVTGIREFIQDADVSIPWIPSVMVFRSIKGFRFFKDRVPGSYVPDELMKELEGEDDVAGFSLGLAAETSRELIKIDGVKGINIMAMGWKEAVPDIIERAGLR